MADALPVDDDQPVDAPTVDVDDALPEPEELIESIRASDLPLAFKCPGSVRKTKTPAKEHYVEADLGSAVHEAGRPLVEGQGIDFPGLTQIAIRYGVEEKQLRIMVALMIQLWGKVRDYFPEAVTEVAVSYEILPGVWLTGHIDIISITEFLARVGDWKTGRVDSDYLHQMSAYAVLVFLTEPHIKEVAFALLWVRDREVEWQRYTRADGQAWLDRLKEQVIDWNGTYKPGPHCIHCRRSHDCAAANALARRDARAILDTEGEVDLTALAPDQQIALYRVAKAVEGYATRILKTFRTQVEVRGDIVGSEDRMTLIDEDRRHANVAKVLPLLKDQGFTLEDVHDVMELSLGDIEKKIAAKAPYRKGAEHIRQFRAALEKAEAVTNKPIRKLTLRR